MDAVSIVFVGILAFVILVLMLGTVFTVSQTERALIERYSRFQRVTGRGLQFKVPLIDAVRRINTQLQQFETQVETKTKDNVFVTIFVSIQLYVMEDTEEHIRSAYYKLYNPGVQIQSYVANAILGHVPSMDFDEVFTSQVAIADFIEGCWRVRASAPRRILRPASFAPTPRSMNCRRARSISSCRGSASCSSPIPPKPSPICAGA